MAASAAADTRPSLLVVDDDSRVRTVVCWQLESEGYEIREAADGNAAWQGIIEHRPDLVVLDLSLPGLSGLDLLRRLRDAGDPTPVVVLSGRSGEGDRIVGLDLGADDYLVKPFSPGELAARGALGAAAQRRAAGAPARGSARTGHAAAHRPVDPRGRAGR